jgi:2-C-methyl-D-erythritol 4-phosphate cytidylyltransferase
MLLKRFRQTQLLFSSTALLLDKPSDDAQTRTSSVREFAVILAAAGKSSRFGDPLTKKVYASVQGKPLWMYAAEVFANRADVGQVILVIAPEDKELFNEKHAGPAAMLGIRTVLGGEQRADSVFNALEVIEPSMNYVAIHDAARPCISNLWIDAVFDAARKSGAAILGIPCSSTVKRVQPGSQEITQTVARDGLWLAQTPQVFRTQMLRDAYRAHPSPSSVTDDASLIEQSGHPVRVVEGSPLNIKVTTKSDLKFVEHALKAVPKANPFPF